MVNITTIKLNLFKSLWLKVWKVYGDICVLSETAFYFAYGELIKHKSYLMRKSIS